MIGKVLSGNLSSPRWELVTTVSEFDEARRAAVELAVLNQTRAWIHLRESDFEEIASSL